MEFYLNGIRIFQAQLEKYLTLKIEKREMVIRVLKWYPPHVARVRSENLRNLKLKRAQLQRSCARGPPLPPIGVAGFRKR